MRIELAHVTKRFGRVTALDDVTLTIAEGSRVGLIGPNGSGKSTLTRVMMGMIAAEGMVRIGGLSPFADRAVLAERLAYVPQAAPALTVSVRDLVRAVASVRRIAPAVVAERGRVGSLRTVSRREPVVGGRNRYPVPRKLRSSPGCLPNCTGT
jgi:ABC-type multidrug transport system ATPase subunit